MKPQQKITSHFAQGSLITFLVLFFLPQLLQAQAPAIEWQKCLGGSQQDQMYSIVQTFDGRYVIAGETSSNDGDIIGNHGGSIDMWVVKLSSNGIIAWQKCIGGTRSDLAKSIFQTSDSGFIVVGSTSSSDGDVLSQNHGGTEDAWIVKLNSIGIIEWEKCLGGDNEDYFNSVIQTKDGGYIAAGFTTSVNGNVSNDHGGGDGWVVKLNSTGSLLWTKCLGSNGFDEVLSIIQTADGGYAAAGHNNSIDELSHGDDDAWITKLNDTGGIQWQRLYGGSKSDIANCIVQTSNKGYVIAGSTTSIDGNVSGNHGGSDAWIFTTDSNGILISQKCFGGIYNETAYSIIKTFDGGYAFSGLAASPDGDDSGVHIYSPNQFIFPDVWIVKLNSSGSFLWQKCLGGEGTDYTQSIIQTSNGGFAIGGQTGSTDGDVIGNNGGWDGWVVKLSEPLSVNDLNTSPNNLSTFPNPASKSTTLSFELPKSSSVAITIYNIMGELIRNFPKAEYESGHNELSVDLGNLVEGTYFIRLSADGISETIPISKIY